MSYDGNLPLTSILGTFLFFLIYSQIKSAFFVNLFDYNFLILYVIICLQLFNLFTVIFYMGAFIFAIYRFYLANTFVSFKHNNDVQSKIPLENRTFFFS